jgi:hypothetical protein
VTPTAEIYGTPGETIDSGNPGVEELPLISPPPPDASKSPTSVDVPVGKSIELTPSADLSLGSALRGELKHQ